MNEGFANYFAGFFDGEGNFLIRLKPDARYDSGFSLQVRIQIQQKSREVLDYIQKTTGTGKVKYLEYRDIYEWSVYQKDQLLLNCEILQGYLRVKHKELDIFMEVMDLVQNKEHLCLTGVSLIESKIKLIAKIRNK